MGDRSKRHGARSGKDPFDYIGVNPATPYRFVVMPGIPTNDFVNNFDIGTVWLEEVNDPDTDPIRIYMLVNKSGTTATWKLLGGNVGNDLVYLTGNSGARVGVDGDNNIDIPSGFAPLSLDGNAGTWTITCNSDGTLATSYPTDSGTAIPASGVLNVVGGSGGSTSGSGSTITIAGDIDVAVQYDADSGSAVPAANVLDVVGSGAISTAAAGNTVTITDGAHDPVTYPTDAGTATPAGNILNMLGGLNISTSGAGDTVTVSMAAIGGPGVVVTDSGGVFSSINGTDGQVIIAATGADPLWADITSSDGSMVFTKGANTLDFSAAGAGIAAAGENINLDHPATVNLNETIHWEATNAAGTEGALFLGGAGSGGSRFLHNYGSAVSGEGNTFLGVNSGNFTLDTSQAHSNVGIGNQCMQVLSTGAYNTGVGNQLFLKLTTGSCNTAMGEQCLREITSGSNNTFIGDGLQITTASNNTATTALHNCSGNNNTCISAIAGAFSLTSSSNTTIITTDESYVNGTASNNILIGSAAGAGSQAQKCFIQGIYGRASISGVQVYVRFTVVNGLKQYAQLITNTSSRKYKDNIVPITESIEEFNPVTFNYKEDKAKRAEFGLIAEEVFKIFPELVVLDDEGLPFSVQYHKLIPLLLKDIQRIRSRIEELEKTIE
jgi:hypothetical protein